MSHRPKKPCAYIDSTVAMGETGVTGCGILGKRLGQGARSVLHPIEVASRQMYGVAVPAETAAMVANDISSSRQVSI
jgi:hypothetical protein